MPARSWSSQRLMPGSCLGMRGMMRVAIERAIGACYVADQHGASVRTGWRRVADGAHAPVFAPAEAATLERAANQSTDNTVAIVASCIGLALGLLDDWLSGDDPKAPKKLGEQVRLPAGHWLGERAANDILVLARKGRAFRSLHTLISRQGGEQVLYRSALALAAATQTWAANTDTSLSETVHAVIR
ncbi:MAG TPA: hypothetical protein VIJ96_19055 [Acidothermaceae bacterium]